MSESEKAEQDVAAARVVERIAEWKAMEAKASYYHYASKAMEASAEVMGARIRRDNAIAAEFADKAFALAETPAPTEVRKQDEQDAAGDFNWLPVVKSGPDAQPQGFPIPLPPQEAPAIPEGFIPWNGGEWTGDPEALVIVQYRYGGQTAIAFSAKTFGPEWSFDGDNGIVAYLPADTGAPPSELDSSQIEGGDRVEPLHDRPKLTDEEHNSLEKLDDKPSTVFLDQAQAAILDTNEDDASYAPVNNAEPVTNPIADDFAKGLLLETEAKAEPRKFGGIFSFGAKKTLVGEGV